MALLGDPAFLAYRGPWEIHDATIVRVTRAGDSVAVELRTIGGQTLRFSFEGVEKVEEHRAEGMMLYALAEMHSPTALRHFRFFNWDEEDDARLDIWCASFRQESGE